MTVSVDTASVSYATNGTVGPFAIPFYFLDNADLRATFVSSAGVEELLALSTNYTVTGAGNVGGGTLTLVLAKAAGFTLVIERAVPITQEFDPENGDELDAEGLERAFDKAAMIDQQLSRKVNAALRVPETASTLPALPSVADRKGKLLSFNATTGAPEVVAPATGSAAALATAIAGASLVSEGAGQVGYSHALAYAAGTLGNRLRHKVVVTDQPYSALPGNTDSQNKACLQAAITALAATGGVIEVPPSIDYGYKRTDASTWPSFTGCTKPVVIYDYAPGNTYAGYPTAYDGKQCRVWFHTPQTTSAGQHDGNTFEISADWAPGFSVDNKQDLSGARAASDNRRARYSSGVRGVTKWTWGQGTLSSSTATEEELCNWGLDVFGHPTLGVGGAYTALIVTRGGCFLFNTDSNAESADFHLKARTTGHVISILESLTTQAKVLLRNSDGSADDCEIWNDDGDLKLRIGAQGTALTIEKANRRASWAASHAVARAVLTYSASMTPTAAASHFDITATNNTAFTINAPTGSPINGQQLTVRIENTSGGALGTATWNAVFKMAAWTNPANGNSRSITFAYHTVDVEWHEVSRTPADVPN